MNDQPASKLRLPKAFAIAILVIAIFMIGLGITVYTFTSLQLQSQNIKVAAVTADAPGSLAGQSVAGPFTALAQINAIEHHTMGITGGKTFAQLGNVATSDGKTYNKDVTAAASTDGQAHSAGDPLSSDDASTYSARSTAQQSSFLQASLYVSVLAFGVSVLIMVVGVIAGLLSISVLSLTSRARRQEATATDAAAAKSKKLQTATQGD